MTRNTRRFNLSPFAGRGRRLLLLLAATAPMTVGLSPARAATSAGNVTGLTLTTNSPSGNITASFALSGGGSVEVTPFAADVVRVDYHWVGPFETDQPMIAKPLASWTSAGATISDQGSKYVIQTSQLDIEVEKTPLKIHFKDKSGFYLLQEDFMEYDAGYSYTGQRGTGSSKLKCQKIMPSGQAYFGLGEYGGPMNRRGREIDCWNTGTFNWGEYQNPTYMNIPFFYGVQPAAGGNPAFVYGVFFNNPCRPLFKFNVSGETRYSFEAGDGRMDYFFIGGGASHSMPKVIDRFSELTGRPTMLPKWGLGHHLSRFSYDNQAWVEYIANQATVEDIPLDAVYLDLDYMDANADGNIGDGQIRQLAFNSRYADPAGMVNYCNARGVKVVPLIEPWLQPGDTAHYTDANNNMHFIKDNGGSTVTRNIYTGAVSWFDYSSTPMNTWWQTRIVNWFNSIAFSGIWNDLTEPEGGDGIPYNGLLWLDGKFGSSSTDSRRWWSNERNYFGLRCARQSYNTMLAKDANKRPFVLSRSGNAGLQRYGVSWSGDTAANWFYQRATIRFGMGAMIAGAAWYGNDVGGFSGTPSAELMVRSTEFNCLTPFFRNHANENSADREPWRYSEPYKSQMRDLIKLRYRLMPYLYTLAYESTQTGEPMNVPPVFDYSADANTYGLSDYEFLVGDFILSAPIYNEGASTRTVYLPYAPGVEWYYWPSGAPNSSPSGDKYAGGQTVTVSAPLGKAPLFVRSGAIIPMSASIQYANQSQPGWMDINCWPSSTTEFTLHEDDGETWDYLGGEYSRRRMVSARTAAAWDFTIEAKQGTYSTGTRDFYVYCYNPGTSVVHGVTLNGAPLAQLANFGAGAQGWLITGEGRIGIKLPDTGAAAALRVSFGDVGDTLQFTAATNSAAENAGAVRVYASRTGAATGAVSVAFATANGTAAAGSDYTATNGTLQWAAGDLANKYFDVVLADDGSYEGSETFSASLSGVVGAELGAPSQQTVTILDNEPLPPDLLVTNPPSAIAVAEGTTNYTLQGVANALNWAGLAWSNQLTGATGTGAIGFSWSLANIGLGVGTNRIVVSATNAGSAVLATDDGTNAVYNDAWDLSDNGGSGWGAWQFYTSSGNSSENGRFMANHGTVNIGAPAWGLYANSGNLSEAKRLLTNALAVGQTVSVRMDNGFINTGSGTGVALQNAAGTTLWEFFFNGGDTFYSMSSTTTDVGWTSAGLDVEFTLTSPTTFRARITPYGSTTRTNTGSLITAADQSIAVFRAWNYNAGAGSDYDFFFNRLTRLGAAGSGPSTSVVVQIVREGTASQIPQDWRDRYQLTGLNSGDDDDRDADGFSNLQEYWADTHPTNGGSFFARLGVADAPGAGPFTVEIGAPTTNSRLYDVSYCSNLVGGIWTPLGYNRSGQADGGALSITVTNPLGTPVHFRSRVFLP